MPKSAFQVIRQAEDTFVYLGLYWSREHAERQALLDARDLDGETDELAEFHFTPATFGPIPATAYQDGPIITNRWYSNTLESGALYTILEMPVY